MKANKESNQANRADEDNQADMADKTDNADTANKVDKTSVVYPRDVLIELYFNDSGIGQNSNEMIRKVNDMLKT